MLTLAIDQSTPRASLALERDGRVLASRDWTVSRFEGQRVFGVYREVLAEAGLAPPDIDRYAVGLGPGTFSGLRISLSMVQALALPRTDPVYGIGSGEIIAHSAFADGLNAPVTVVGDARRNRLWYATFDRIAGRPVARADYALTPAAELPGLIPPDGTVITPDGDRIGKALLALCGDRARVVPESRTPAAPALAALTALELSAGVPFRTLEPIYIHPPVFVPPRQP